MLICQSNADLQPGTESQNEDWMAGVLRYHVEEMLTFIAQHRESAGQHLLSPLLTLSTFEGSNYMLTILYRSILKLTTQSR